MLRLLLFIFVFYGIFTGLKDGWLIIKWSYLLHHAGFLQTQPDKPINWNQFLIKQFQKGD
tara:strand:- start:333 stop:512 length:180 start_codon:yes stop_codon:yes gene_type:complete